MEFAGIRAIVSGAASGLGNATARRIVEHGGRVAMLDMNEALGQEAAAALGDAALFIRTDVSDEAQVDAAVAQAVAALGGVDLAVSCAGILGAGRVLGRDGPMPGAQFRKVIEVNLLGTFLLGKAAAAAMADNPPGADGERGVLVQTASVAAYEGQIGQAAYSASKGGVAAMALPMAREFARIGVRVNTIAPGIFMTPMMAGMPPEVQQSLGAQVPFPSRLGEPEEYAAVVQFICETRMLNAEVIRLDGAIRMQPR